MPAMGYWLLFSIFFMAERELISRRLCVLISKDMMPIEIITSQLSDVWFVLFVSKLAIRRRTSVIFSR